MKETDFYKKLIQQGESEQVEFKLKIFNEIIIAKTLTAFANSNGGYLFIGVADNGEIIGLQKSECDSLIQRIENICSSLFSYPYKIQTIYIENKCILVVEIKQAPEHLRPITIGNGDIYVRDNDKIIKHHIKRFSEFKTKTYKTRKIKGFIAMSFREEEEPALIDYYNAMYRAVEKTRLPIQLFRMDLKEGDYEISKEIMKEIDSSDFVICDFTLNSSNVYFEIGYARGKELPIIQTARKETKLEFDVRNWKTIFYRNATELESKIGQRMIQTYKEIIK